MGFLIHLISHSVLFICNFLCNSGCPDGLYGFVLDETSKIRSFVVIVRLLVNSQFRRCDFCSVVVMVQHREY